MKRLFTLPGIVSLITISAFAFVALPPFKNTIKREGRCGFASSGQYDKLVNTDTSARYTVTVKTKWSGGTEHGETQETHISEAGGTKTLGCTEGAYINGRRYERSIVGEVKLGS